MGAIKTTTFVPFEDEEEPEVIPTVEFDVSGIEEFARPDLIPMIEEIAKEYGICPELIEAIIERESRGITDTYASEGSYGLMQIYKKWNLDRIERLGITDLYDERSNITLGADALNEWRDRYGDDLYLILGKYNGQSDCAEGVPNDYADFVISRAHELELLHDSQKEENE